MFLKSCYYCIMFAASVRTSDPMCNLNEDQRFRLCHLVFSSDYFSGQIKIPASYSLVDERCYMSSVSFTRTDIRAEVNGRQYWEWMIACHVYLPSDVSTEIDTTFFISRAYKNSKNFLSSNDVFVYRQINGSSSSHQFYLVNVFTNIRL